VSKGPDVAIDPVSADDSGRKPQIELPTGGTDEARSLHLLPSSSR
jgi:hypothetical protein